MTKLSIVPVFQRATIRCQSADFYHCAKQLFSVLPECGFPPVLKWEDAHIESESLTDMETMLEKKKAASEWDSPTYVMFHFTSGYLGGIKLYQDVSDHKYCSINIDKCVHDDTLYTDVVKFQKQIIELCKRLLVDPGIRFATLLAEGGGATAIPDVPLVDGNSHICVTSDDEVNAIYDAPNTFWNAGWEITAESGSQRLLTRDLDVVCGPEYLERIMPHQWDMARAAMSGKTSYSKPVLHPSEEAVYTSGDAKLFGVGYREKDKMVEFSCVLNRQEHINGWEIFALYHIVESAQLSDGSPVNTVQVVFEECWAANQEKRPLLDIGCKVFCYRGNGEMEEVME